ncbi:hypothetical protein K7W42_05995 [Deinococcus sp. HMF7604]|uniref:hypothetical protein n=1 Tax=Deinococcus betulae TaxID=2873312 RepID=UPI001CCD219D|nr:hypothetical protein [Deinococcus betulae]MBZ9750410.1 hypothetical protein [Deinococcus betulae]
MSEYKTTAQDNYIQVVGKTLKILKDTWQITPRQDIRVHLADEWWSGIFPHLTSIEYVWRRIYRSRDEAIWEKSAACHVPLSRCALILLRSRPAPRISEVSVGSRLFQPASKEEQEHWRLCHEITHACTSHLHLPFWLNEGLAMLVTDLYAERQTIQVSTRPVSRDEPTPSIDVVQLQNLSEDEWLAIYAQSYWRTRQLFDEHPQLLQQALCHSQ